MELLEIQPSLLFPRLVADRGHQIYQRDLGRHMYGSAEQAQWPWIRVMMVGDLGLNFVVNHAEGGTWDILREVDREGLAEWDNTGLITQGFRNLRDGFGANLEIIDVTPNVHHIVTASPHTSAFALLSNLWDGLVEHVGHSPYIAVPAQGLLLASPSNSASPILQLQSIVRDTFFNSPVEDLISKAIFQRVDGDLVMVATAF